MCKKNILVLTSKIPYPLNDGGSIAQFVFTDALRDKYNFTYLFNERNIKETQNIAQLKKQWTNVNIQSVKSYNSRIDNKHKTPKSQMLKDYMVSFYRKFKQNKNTPIKIANPQKYIDDQLNNPFNFTSPIAKKYIDFVTKYIEENKIDLVQVEHIPFMNIIECLPSSINTLYVHHELQFEKYNSFPIQDVIYKKYIVNLVKNVELSILSKYKNIITFSEVDKQLLEITKKLPNRIYSCPFPVLSNENSFIPTNKTAHKFIFHGSDNHHANFDALDWYKNAIAPILKKETNDKLYVTGNWSQENQNYLNENNDFIFTGFIDDLKYFSKNSIMIVPIRIGSGIRTKIIQAMAEGLPVISTKKGIEGINVIDESIVTDNPIFFAENIIKLIHDHEKYELLSKKGFLFFKNNFSEEKLINQRISILEEIL